MYHGHFEKRKTGLKILRGENISSLPTKIWGRGAIAYHLNAYELRTPASELLVIVAQVGQLSWGPNGGTTALFTHRKQAGSKTTNTVCLTYKSMTKLIKPQNSSGMYESLHGDFCSNIWPKSTKSLSCHFYGENPRLTIEYVIRQRSFKANKKYCHFM